MDQRLIDKKIALGLVSLFRVTPWILMGDKRKLDALVGSALGDARRFTDNGDYITLLRGTMHTWLGCLGTSVNPAVIEQIIDEVTRQVDKVIEDKYDDGLGGTPTTLGGKHEP